MEKQTREFAAKVYGREWLPPICWLSLPPLFSLYLLPPSPTLPPPLIINSRAHAQVAGPRQDVYLRRGLL